MKYTEQQLNQMRDAAPDMYEAIKSFIMHKNLSDLHPIDYQRLEQSISKIV